MFAQLTILMLAGSMGPLLAYGRRGLVPAVIGELIAGVVLGHTGFGVINSSVEPLPVLSAIGFAMLMFTAGTHVDIGSPAIRQGFARGVLGLAVVAVTAIPLGLLVDRSLSIGHPALIAVIIAGSSAAIAFPIIEERKLAGPNVAFLIAWVAVADSVTVVMMPLTLAKSGSPLEALGGDAAIIVVGILALLAAERIRANAVLGQMRNESLQRGWAWQVRISLVLLLGLSAIAQETGASTLVAGFLAGMILVRLRESDRLALQFTGVANGFFVPLFFVLLGAQLDLRALLTTPSRILLAICLVCATVITHVIAARVAGHERYLATGLAASAQLGMPAAAASLGLTTGLLTPAVAAALVAGGVLTLIPATIGSLMLARGATLPKPSTSGTAAASPT
ncbi:MAG TPA: cation:proton antiporter [Candidatus Acidoferrales bacterium]|nr:cation:proton antiporter [Candidatus Acidoferrales bacterium]